MMTPCQVRGVNLSINQSANQPINQSISQSVAYLLWPWLCGCVLWLCGPPRRRARPPSPARLEPPPRAPVVWDINGLGGLGS